MPVSSVNMVLRSVFLPLELDKELGQMAISRDVSRSELMRECILQGLQEDMGALDEKRLTQKHLDGDVAVPDNTKPKSTAKVTFPASKAAAGPARRAHKKKAQP